MTCNEYRERMSRDIDRLASDETSETRRHLAHCPECQRYYDEEVHMVALIAASVRPLSMREDLTAKIVDRLPEAEELDDLPTPGTRLLWWSAGLAAAAMVIVVLFALQPGEEPSDLQGNGGSTPAVTPQEKTPLEKTSDKWTDPLIIVAKVKEQRLVGTQYGVGKPDSEPFLDRLFVQPLSSLQGGMISACFTTMPFSGGMPISSNDVVVDVTKYSLTFEMKYLSEEIPKKRVNIRHEKGLDAIKDGDKVIVSVSSTSGATSQTYPGASFRSINLPMSGISRVIPWSEALEKEIREEVARQNEHIIVGRIIEGKLESTLPKDKGLDIDAPERTSDEIRVTIDNDGHFTVRLPGSGRDSSKLTTTQDLQDYLRETATNSSGVVVVLIGDRSTPWESIVRTVNACKTLGLKNIEFAGKPDDAPPKSNTETVDLSTPEKAWAAFVEALKSGDEERIKAVTTELGFFCLGEHGSDNKKMKKLGETLAALEIHEWMRTKDDRSLAVAGYIPGEADGKPYIQLVNTPAGWKLDRWTPGK